MLFRSVHVPLALRAGVSADTVAAIAEGRRPRALAADEALAHDFAEELLRNRGISDATYAATVARFGEHGVIDMLGVLGYFTTVSMVLNVAHTPAPAAEGVTPLQPLPM